MSTHNIYFRGFISAYQIYQHFLDEKSDIFIAMPKPDKPAKRIPPPEARLRLRPDPLFIPIMLQLAIHFCTKQKKDPNSKMYM